MPSSLRASPKVLDFGVARTIDSDVQMTTLHTEVGQIIGTIPYMSPEQVAGQPEEIDTRSDVYSLGVVLYELLSGGLPHDLTGKSLPEAARIIREEEPAPLRAAFRTPHGSGGPEPREVTGPVLGGRGSDRDATPIRTSHAVPEPSRGAKWGAKLRAYSSHLTAHRTDLETIVGKALEKEPARRYASVSQLASDITHYLRNEPISALPASTFYQLRKLAVRHKAPFAITGVALALILALTVWMTVLFIRARAAEALANTEATRATDERDKAIAARQSEAEARTSAEEVAGFLQKLFEQADPGNQESPDPKVRDLLEAGVARLDAELADQPLVYARLALVLGRVYASLADFPRARGLLESALEIRRRELGQAHLDVATSLEGLAHFHTRIGQHDRSHALRLEALQIQRSSHSEPHAQVALALENLGAGKFYAGEYAAALDYLQQSLDIKRALNSSDMEMGMAVQNVGYALQRLGRNDEAERALLESLDLKRRGDLAHDCRGAVEVGLSLEALANVEYGRGNLGAAEEYCRQQVEALRRGCAPTDPKLAWALRNYAFLVFRNRGPAQAEPIYRESLAICVTAYGEQHPEVAFTLEHLARIRADQDDLEGAMELHQRELKIRRALLGNDHDTVAASLRRLGETTGRLGRFQEAEDHLLESHAIFTRNHGESSKESAPTVQALVALYEQQEQCDLTDEWRATLARIDAQ